MTNKSPKKIKKIMLNDQEILNDAESLVKEFALNQQVDGNVITLIYDIIQEVKICLASLDSNALAQLTKKVEELSDTFRKGKVELDHIHITLLSCASDFVGFVLNRVEHQLTGKAFQDESDSALLNFTDVMDAIANDEELEPTQPSEYVPIASVEELPFDISPEMIKDFVDEAHELCDTAESCLLALEKEPGNIQHAKDCFRAFHSLKGNSAFFEFTDIGTISHRAEDILDGIRNGERSCDAGTNTVLLKTVDVLRDGVRKIEQGRRLTAAQAEEMIQELNALNAESPGLSGRKTGDRKQVPEVNDVIEAPPALSGKDRNAGQENSADEFPMVIDLENGSAITDDEDALMKAADVEESRNTTVAKSGNEEVIVSGKDHQKVIRVDVDKLDTLLNLIGELVISEALVTKNPDLNGLELDRFEKAAIQLDKITRDIQETAMSMRMVPLFGVFQKMTRLVHDVAGQSGKKAELTIIGEETEVDKSIAEQVADPLIHLVRNAVDHGIETPQDRRAAGKPENGKVIIEAKHAVGEVWIIVKDDGRGLNRDAIIRKAIEKKLMSAAQQADMKDEDVWQLIFESGLSTAKQVSNISGRGVGMDVVKHNVQKLGGRIDIKSELGKGTSIAIRIPLTLAIIDGIVIKVGQNSYIIPNLAVQESLRARPEQITVTPDGLEVLHIRHELLPIIRLHELYKVGPIYTDLSKGILIVVENNTKRCCLFVDELIGQQQIVIKSMPRYLKHTRGISGCTILGDGDIGMILDVSELLDAI